MPESYQIKLKLIPAPENQNPQLENIGGALAFIIAFDTSKRSAEKKAIRYALDYGWHVEQVSSVQLLLPEHLLLLDTKTEKLYKDAELLGICGHFDAWQKGSRSGSYSVHSLKKPPKK